MISAENQDIFPLGHGITVSDASPSKRSPEHAISQAPILHLPPELLRQIFPYCIPSRVVPSVSKPPLTLGSVCRSWYEASVECHTLWNCLSIGTNPCFQKESCIAGVELWLSRSGNLPLTIQFRPSSLPKIHDGLLQAICLHVNRWSVVSLQIHSAYGRVGSLLSADTLMLKELSISYFTDPLEHDRSSSLDLTRAHKLEQLTFSSSLSFRATPPSSLKRLTIERRVPVNYALELLQLCPLLEYVHLCPISPQNISNGSIITTHLKELIIIDEGGAGVLLDRVVLPSVSIVKLFTVFDGLHPSWAHLSQALRRSQANLQQLTIGQGILSESEILECLKLSPSLIIFILGSYVRNQPTSCILTHLTSDVPLICPKLKYLEIVDIDKDISSEIISQFLQCRWLNLDSSSSSPRRLEQLRIKDHNPENRFELWMNDPVIQQCSTEGFKFSVDS